MLKFIHFTNQIRNIQIKLLFWLHVSLKFIKILFKRNRKLRQKIFYFSNQNVFDKSVFTLRYDFENALYYELNGYHKSINGQSLEIYANDLPEKLEFVIYSFTSKEVFYLEFKATEIIHSEKFDTKFIKTFDYKKTNLKHSLKQRKITVLNHYLISNYPQIIVNKKNLKTNISPFNSKDYL